MGLFDGDGSGGIGGMLSGLFGGGQAGAAPTDPNAPVDPNAPMQILPPAQTNPQPSFLDALKANIAKNGPQAFSGLATQAAGMNKPATVAPLAPIQFGQVRQPQQAYGSLMPRIGQ